MEADSTTPLKGDDGDIRGAAADVDDQVPVGLGDVDAGADGRGHGLLDQIHAAGAGLDAGVDHGALLHLGDAGGHADDDPGLEQLEAVDLVDKFLEHALGHVVIGNHAVAQGTDRHDVAGRAAQHGLGVRADFQQLARVFIHRHHGGLVEHDALSLYIDQDRRGTQINANIFC